MKTTRLRRNVGNVLLLTWAFVCLLLFILFPGRLSYIQWSDLSSWQSLSAKLIRLDAARDIASLIGSFLGTLFFFLACTSFGNFLGRIINIRNTSFSSGALAGLGLLATEFLIGGGVFSIIFLLLAGLHQLTPAYVILLVLAGGLLGAKQTRVSVTDLVSSVSSTRGAFPKNRWMVFALLLCGMILFFSLFYSTARISYDSSAIYFSNAKLTALTNHIQYFTADSFIVSAFQSSILYTALLQVFGDQSARLFSWYSGIVFISLTLALADQMRISRQGIIILLALLLTSTAFLDLVGDGKVDILTSAYAVGAVYWMSVARENKSEMRSIHWLIGFLIGFAMIGRPFNVFLLGIFVAFFYLQWVQLRNGSGLLDTTSFVSSLLPMGVGVAALGIYHLFINQVIQGDPLAFLTSLSEINPSTGPWDYNPQTILAARLLYPFIVTFYNTPQTLGNISPLFIAFLPALLLQHIAQKRRFSKQLSALLITALATLLLWIFLFFTVYEIRYVLFLWAILFMPVAEAIATMRENEDRMFQNVVMTIVIGLLAFTLVRVIYISIDTYSPIDAQGNPECNDSRFCEYLKSINKVASPGDRVLTLGAFRYYLRNDLLSCSTRNTEYKTLQELTSHNPMAFWEEVYRQGYKYIAYENDYTTRHLQFAIIPSPSNTPAWIELDPIFGVPGDLQVAYKINAKNPPVEVEAICRKDPQKGWEIHHLVP